VADAVRDRLEGLRLQLPPRRRRPKVHKAGGGGAAGRRRSTGGDILAARPGAVRGFWRDASWVLGQTPAGEIAAWPAQPVPELLVDGSAGGLADDRVEALRALGNAIVPQVAAVFVQAVMDALIDGAFFSTM